MALFVKWNGKRRLNRNRYHGSDASSNNIAAEEAALETESSDELRRNGQVDSASKAVSIAESPALQQSNDMLAMMDNIQRELEAMRRLTRSDNGASQQWQLWISSRSLRWSNRWSLPAVQLKVGQTTQKTIAMTRTLSASHFPRGMAKRRMPGRRSVCRRTMRVE